MKQTQNLHDPGTAPLGRLMLRYSIPCILSLVISALYNVVDQIFIGNSELSALGNAATGAVFPMFIAAQGFAWCFGDGCGAFLNLCQGRREADSAHRTIGTGITLTLLSSLLLMAIFYLFKTPLLLFFGASENSIAMAIEYTNIILAFFPCYMLANMLNGVIRADGSPSVSMVSMIIGAAINLILDPVFIFGFHWGMTGAALATGIGQLASFVVSVIYFCGHTKGFRITLRSLIPDFSAVWGALRLGLSSFVTQMTILVIALLTNYQLARYGALSAYGVDVPIAVFGIQNKVFTVVIDVVVGIVLGCQPIISYNVGACNYARVKRIYSIILICSFTIGIASTLLFQLAPLWVARLFGEPTNIPNPEDYWVFAKLTFRIFLSFITFNCVIKVCSIFFQAVGKPVWAVTASMIRDVVCFAPLILLLPRTMSIEGILYAGPIADLISMAVATYLTVSYYRSLTKAEQAAHAPQVSALRDQNFGF